MVHTYHRDSKSTQPHSPDIINVLPSSFTPCLIHFHRLLIYSLTYWSNPSSFNISLSLYLCSIIRSFGVRSVGQLCDQEVGSVRCIMGWMGDDMEIRQATGLRRPHTPTRQRRMRNEETNAYLEMRIPAPCTPRSRVAICYLDSRIERERERER